MHLDWLRSSFFDAVRGLEALLRRGDRRDAHGVSSTNAIAGAASDSLVRRFTAHRLDHLVDARFKPDFTAVRLLAGCKRSSWLNESVPESSALWSLSNKSSSVVRIFILSF